MCYAWACRVVYVKSMLQVDGHTEQAHDNLTCSFTKKNIEARSNKAESAARNGEATLGDVYITDESLTALSWHVRKHSYDEDVQALAMILACRKHREFPNLGRLALSTVRGMLSCRPLEYVRNNTSQYDRSGSFCL